MREPQFVPQLPTGPATCPRRLFRKGALRAELSGERRAFGRAGFCLPYPAAGTFAKLTQFQTSDSLRGVLPLLVCMLELATRILQNLYHSSVVREPAQGEQDTQGGQ